MEETLCATNYYHLNFGIHFINTRLRLAVAVAGMPWLNHEGYIKLVQIHATPLRKVTATAMSTKLGEQSMSVPIFPADYVRAHLSQITLVAGMDLFLSLNSPLYQLISPHSKDR
jgi:hypothetical protein